MSNFYLAYLTLLLEAWRTHRAVSWARTWRTYHAKSNTPDGAITLSWRRLCEALREWPQMLTSLTRAYNFCGIACTAAHASYITMSAAARSKRAWIYGRERCIV